jgi:NAD(P)-dependent dehydrogenase (short-subunit alcohol dehydrogenase family)
MTKTIIVCGYGPGISSAVAERFGAEGFQVALAARNGDRLAAGVRALEAKGIRAAGFPTDLGDPGAARALPGKVREKLGPVTVVEWNAYSNGAGDLLAADPAAIREVLDVAVTSLLTVVRAALPDLKQQKDAAVLTINGGFGYADPQTDAVGVQFNAMGLSVANAAKHKLAGLLAKKLQPEGVYVGEAMVVGTIKGGVFDRGQPGTLPAGKVADKLWDLYRARAAVTVEIS